MMTSDSPRGQPIPNTLEAWKYHAALLSGVIENQRQEIKTLKQKVNNLTQKLERYRG
jgi:hypothetical protein